MNKINRLVIALSLISLFVIILFNVANINNISIDCQTTIYTKNNTIIIFARFWDVGISFVDNTTGGYGAFSLAHGYFHRDSLIGVEQ